MKRVYLDYSATSPIKPQVKKAMAPYFHENFGNPSSIHEEGRIAQQAIQESRQKIATFLNASSSEIIFTSGGTEADNLAIRGLVRGLKSQQKPHIITSQIEHHAILNTSKALEKENLAEVTFLKPDNQGIINVAQVKQALRPETRLISIMYVNNEVGTIQPIREIGKMIEKENKKRGQDLKAKIYFHTDVVQATEYQPMEVNYLHVDMLTISAHKIGGPKGTGVLFVKKGTPVQKCLYGGEQELNLRAGTENVAGIVGIGQAIEELKIKNRELRIKKIIKLRDYFINRVLKEIPNVHLNGSKEFRSPNNANFYFEGIEGESILLNLDLAGVAASSGSACTSLSLEPSHVLMALYNKAERAHGSIRFSLGFYTTKEDLNYTVENLKKIVAKLRAMSPLWSPNKEGLLNEEKSKITSASKVLTEE